MKELIVYDRKNYDTSLQRFTKHSVRAIIINDNKIAMLYSKKNKFYCFPGGGIEQNETKIEALIREIKEETGLIIKPQSIKEYGFIKETRKAIYVEGTYELYDFYYTCDVEDDSVAPQLTQFEKESEYELIFVQIDEAILENESGLHIDPIYTEAETYVLKLLNKQCTLT